ncbi:MAG: hypothetical protein IPG39_03585 [Bacteroidetes bacterium]|nr:hypothetical protein [Bacteroidota bacterium]
MKSWMHLFTTGGDRLCTAKAAGGSDWNGTLLGQPQPMETTSITYVLNALNMIMKKFIKERNNYPIANHLSDAADYWSVSAFKKFQGLPSPAWSGSMVL